MNSFAEHLNSLIREHPDTVSLIAQKAKISRPSLYDLINGKTHPRLTTFDNLCSALTLSEYSLKKIQELFKSERLKYSKKEQNIYLNEKKKLLSELSDTLLSRGHEISQSKLENKTDLILRQNKNRIPILVCPIIIDYPPLLGILLSSMHKLTANRGYLCRTKLVPADKSEQSLFQKYGTKIVTIKTLIRDIETNTFKK